jgi:SAM-dependent methyltransferase
VSFKALKARQSEAWGSAPWGPMAARLAAIHDHLVARLAPGRDERWLDVGSGTGAVALRAARAGARVTGVDLSPVMIDAARRIAGGQGVGIRFEVGDAERLPYEERASTSSLPRSGSSWLRTTPRQAASLRAFAARAAASAWSPGRPIRRPSACTRPSGRHASPAPAIAANGAARSTWPNCLR